MARGRKSQPAEVKIAKGNPGKRPVGVVETDDLPTLGGAVPDNLQGDGKGIYRDLVEQLSTINLLRATDRNLLERYADTLNEYWKVTRRLRGAKSRGGGYTYEAEKIGGGKLLRLNPLFTVQERLARRLDTMEDKLGLSPRARQEIMYRLANAAPAQPSLPMAGEGAGKTAVEGSAEDPLGLAGPHGGAVH